MVRALIALTVIALLTVAAYFLFSYLISAIFDIRGTIDTKREVVEQERREQAEGSVLEDLRRILTQRGELPVERTEQTPLTPVTERNQVVAPSGIIARNDAPPLSANAPQQSEPLTENAVAQIKSLQKGTILELTIAETGIVPSTLEVRRGELVTLIATSGDAFTHVLAFADPALQAVAIGLSGFETRAIAFNAPAQAGEYEFLCNVPGHAGRGERGVLVLR
jgi:hypothetical protein